MIAAVMTIEDDIAVLDRVPTLRLLGEGALRSLAIAVETRSMQADEVLFAAGEAADGAFVVQHGSISLKRGRAGEADVLAGPGTLLGESALLAPTQRPATAAAREACTVIRIPRTTFLKILDSYPDAAKRLRDLIALRTDQWAGEMENIRATLTRGRHP